MARTSSKTFPFSERVSSVPDTKGVIEMLSDLCMCTYLLSSLHAHAILYEIDNISNVT